MSATLILVNPVSPIAYVVADTRMNIHGQGLSDAGEFDAHFPDGSIVHVGDSFRKLRRFSFGGIAAAGTFFLMAKSFEALTQTGVVTVNRAKEIITEAYHAAAATATGLGEDPATIEAAFTFLCIEDHNFRLDCVAFGRVCPPLAVANFLLMTPPEFPPTTKTLVTGQISNQVDVRAGRAAICSNVRLFASIFHTIHSASTTVSHRIELVVVQDKDNQLVEKYLQADCPRIMNSSDAEIWDLLTRIS